MTLRRHRGEAVIPRRMKRRIRDGVVGALLLGAVLYGGCGGSNEEAATSRTYSSWDEFTDSDAGKQAGRHQVVFIGIDAGVWHFIDRLIEDGRLPNFARIKSEGVTGPLMSVQTYVTPPAWTAMFTGYLPARTGVYSFGYWDRETREFVSANSDDIHVPSVWEAASRAGLRVGVFNVPMTYPPRPVNGKMVAGQMTPIDVFNPPRARSVQHLMSVYDRHYPLPKNSFAPPAPALLADSLNVFVMTIYDGTRDGKQHYDSLSVRVLARDADPAGVIEPLSEAVCALGEYSPWLRILYRHDGDVVEAFTRVKITVEANQTRTELAPIAMPIDAEFTYPPEFAAELNDRFGYYLPTKFLPKEVVGAVTDDAAGYASFFYDYDDWDLFCFVFTQTDNIQHVAGYSELSAQVYERIDRLVGEIMDRMPSDATLIVGSDHGSAEHTYGIDMNQLLNQMRLLEYSQAPKIDHERTLVFHNLWHLYFNRELITRDELSARGYDVPAVADPVEWLTDLLRRTKARASDGSREFIIDAEPLPADAVGHAPDMVIKSEYKDYMVAFWNIMNPDPDVIRELVGTEKFWHTRDGVLMMWGNDVKQGMDSGPRDIEDIGPTMLYLLGLPVADDMDGSVMTDLFKTRRPLYVNKGYRDIPREVVLPDSERESLQKKLRSLGYIQ